jgi:hypothetical protein
VESGPSRGKGPASELLIFSHFIRNPPAITANMRPAALSASYREAEYVDEIPPEDWVENR